MDNKSYKLGDFWIIAKYCATIFINVLRIVKPKPLFRFCSFCLHGVKVEILKYLIKI